jgi:hypothetical protein
VFSTRWPPLEGDVILIVGCERDRTLPVNSRARHKGVIMQLTSATAYAIKTPPPNYGGYLWYFVKLETDSGLVGWGETAVLFSM